MFYLLLFVFKSGVKPLCNEKSVPLRYGSFRGAIILLRPELWLWQRLAPSWLRSRAGARFRWEVNTCQATPDNSVAQRHFPRLQMSGLE